MLFYTGQCRTFTPALTAVEVIRGLIDSIELTPVEEDGKKTLAVSLRGKLAAILAMGAGIKKPLEESGLEMRVTKLVAGAGFVLCDLFLAPAPNTNRLDTMHQ